MYIPVGRRPAELLGLKEKRDLDEWLKTASKGQMQERHENCSYRKGSAEAGLFINSGLSCVLSPCNIVGTAISIQQLSVAHREQRKIEKAARENHGVDFREGPDRVARRRHKLAGAAFKTSTAAVLLGQDDVVSLGMAVGGLDLLAPVTELEVGMKEASDAFHGNSAVSVLQSAAEKPAKLAQEFFGIDHKPTWEDVLQAPDVKLATPATGVIGVAVEANVVMLAADLAGEEAHRQIVQASRREDGESDEESDEESEHGCGDHQFLRRQLR